MPGSGQGERAPAQNAGDAPGSVDTGARLAGALDYIVLLANEGVTYGPKIDQLAQFAAISNCARRAAALIKEDGSRLAEAATYAWECDGRASLRSVTEEFPVGDTKP